MNRQPSFPRRWNVGGATLLAETFSSRIWKVARADGTPAVVKALKPFPDVEDELRGAYLLAWRRGAGAVRLLGRDGRKMLIEYAGDRRLSQEIDARGDEAATEIAAEVMTRLHASSDHPAPPQLQPLADRFESLFRVAEAAGAASAYVEAANTARRLLANPRDVRPLHGDLNHDNIMLGERGWLAIDPKGVLGDPAFDAANLFYNPLDRDALCLDGERIARMAVVFSRALRQPPAAILDHAFAYGCLSAAWHAQDGNDRDEARELAIANAVREVNRPLKAARFSRL